MLEFFVFLIGIIPQLIQTTPVLFSTNDPNFLSTPVSLSRLSSSNLIKEKICSLKINEIHLHLITVDDLTHSEVQRTLKDKINSNNVYHYFPNVDDDISRKLSLLPRSNQYECSHIHFRIDSEENYPTLTSALKSIEKLVEESTKTYLIVFTSNTVQRTKRATSNDNLTRGKDILFSDDRTCMLYVENLLWNNVDGQKHNAKTYQLDFNTSLCLPNETKTSPDPNQLVTLKLNWQNEAKDVSVPMSFQARLINRYWYIENITIHDKLYRYFAYGMANQMDTPPSYSYVCNSATFVRYDPSTKYGTYNFSDKFYLTNFQFQPFRANGQRFGQANYCTSFFTAGIWMGITTSLLCLAILFFGVHRMMSIKSNDRFDDPKGKPLLIKAQE